MGRYDREKAARILVEANIHGDEKVAKKYQITRRTIQNYRAWLASDPELSQTFARLNAAVERSWHNARTNALRAIMSRLAELATSEKDMDKLSRAAKNVGEVDVAIEMLSEDDERSRAGEPGPPPPEDSGGDSGETEPAPAGGGATH